MIASFLITFRETLEAALVVGIILSYLIKTNQTQYNKTVYFGVFSGILASIIAAILFIEIAGEFKGTNEEIFEGVTMLIGAILLTTMILWMMNQKHVTQKLEQKVETEITEGHRLGLFSLVFVSVLREGIETVIFLSAANFVSSDNNLVGAAIGIFVAILIGYAMLAGLLKVNIKKFFNITSVLLILFAAGLVAHGIHELQEANVAPVIEEHVWDINPEINSDGTYPPFHDKGEIGQILSVLFGYNGNPSLIEILSYMIYIIFTFILWTYINKKKASSMGDSIDKAK